MDTPQSMQAELEGWNNGMGIELETWIGCEGRFALAVGYATIFWPEFEVIDDYIVRQGSSAETLRAFSSQPGASRLSVEVTVNHIHLVDLHYRGCPDASPDKLLALGKVLKEIYEAKLKWQFPDRPCAVRLYIPEDIDALDEYELSFWQVAHEKDGCCAFSR
jgi:hypothetical protein